MDEREREKVDLKQFDDNINDSPNEYWESKKKRENQNIVVCIIIAVGGIIFSGIIQNIIPAIIGIILSVIIYQRDQ